MIIFVWALLALSVYTPVCASHPTNTLYKSKDSSTLLTYSLTSQTTHTILVFEFTTRRHQGLLQLIIGNPFQRQDILEISWDDNTCTVLDKYSHGGHTATGALTDAHQDFVVTSDECSRVIDEEAGDFSEKYDEEYY